MTDLGDLLERYLERNDLPGTWVGPGGGVVWRNRRRQCSRNWRTCGGRWRRLSSTTRRSRFELRSARVWHPSRGRAAACLGDGVRAANGGGGRPKHRFGCALGVFSGGFGIELRGEGAACWKRKQGGPFPGEGIRAPVPVAVYCRAAEDQAYAEVAVAPAYQVAGAEEEGSSGKRVALNWNFSDGDILEAQDGMEDGEA